MQHWYAVQSKPRQEALAEENLERQGYRVYCPRLRLRKLRRGQWTHSVEPLFPRYLFIRTDPEEQSLAPVRSTLGVATLVRFGHLLRPVPEEVITFLKQQEDQAAQQRIDDTWPHQPGDQVEILEGPFAGLTAIYQMPKPEDRALLLLTLLGRPNKITVDMAHIA
jgi:transcriptional antiterminator RfaH